MFGAVAGVSLATLAGCTSAPSGRALACPAAPYRPRVTSGDLEQEALRGPAPGDVSHGVFVHRLVLDGGALSVRPPRHSDHPRSSGDDALCEAMASRLPSGWEIGRQSRDTVAAGLARVTIDPSLPSFVQRVFGKPKPAIARYDDRLAWVVVVSPPGHYFGPAPHCPRTTGDGPVHHNYVVFVVDARTGGDALLYTEGDFRAVCPHPDDRPYVDLPARVNRRQAAAK